MRIEPKTHLDVLLVKEVIEFIPKDPQHLVNYFRDIGVIELCQFTAEDSIERVIASVHGDVLAIKGH